MKTLSIFVDESGDFGEYQPHTPFYIFTLLFHDQSNSISDEIKFLETGLAEIGLHNNHCFHAGPLIRREEDYCLMSISERRKCMNKITAFAKNSDISYMSFYAHKKYTGDQVQLTAWLTKQLSTFITTRYDFFSAFEKIIVYYDNGQIELSRLLATAFTVLLPQSEFRRVLPADYRLFQVADLFCTLELIKLKAENNILSKSELAFFGSTRDMNKNYIKPMQKKKLI